MAFQHENSIAQLKQKIGKKDPFEKSAKLIQMMMMAKHGMQIQKHIGFIQMHCKEMSTKNNLPAVHSDGVLVIFKISTESKRPSSPSPPATTMKAVSWC